MPVEDHAVHEKVKQKEGFRYGCHNKPRPTDETTYLAPDGWCQDYIGSSDWLGEMGFREVKHVMSRDCRFDMSFTDPGCEGCWWQGMGEKYAEEIRRNGK
jgi:hypothetical protein